ncbi:MAG: non-homologous end-joining DNA ligase [Actinomycetota bacterium]|nr:non-homologous end-joining DNA ligase [Actinomycetota bacterium]
MKAGRRNVEISNPDKVFYPETGFTKADVAEYYQAVSEALLPHLKNRLVTLKRYPNGVEGSFFYEKQCPKHRPEWVDTAPMRCKDGKVIDYCLLNDRAALAWSSNLANLELHAGLARSDDLARPRSLVFDLDPGEGTGILECGETALWIRDLFSSLDLESFAKTSGSKGLQMFVPLNTKVSFDDTRSWAHAVALRLRDDHPEAIVTKQSKEERRGKVLIDWSQNDDHKTTVSVYSLRARPRPTVSTPVTWAEIESALAAEDPEALVFEASEVLDRVEREGDLFEPVLKLRQKLPAGGPDAIGAS